jgi:CRISPR system Cascade subunit CasD
MAVGEDRPTFDRPTKSAILGLVAAATGIRRDEEERQLALAAGYWMAIRIDSPGFLLRDYHTAQVPPSGKGKRKIVFQTRKEELSVPKDGLNTVLSSRDYRCDALYTVCLWSRTANPPYHLTVLKHHLEHPEFLLYLGRKSCPLSMPVQAQIVNAENLASALSSVRFPDPEFIGPLLRNSQVRVFWEGDEASGYEKEHTVTRCDDPSSRRRWQFTNRQEHYAMVKLPAGG